ncbi:IS21-like element helper ATPase IstB [Propionivibrio dicarboxylicus]|uniref:DNA replication protein DnaC n=1 Tax=Propionivibrio dicarboxylicus TaxID=83767 RepID=A0A1G7Z8Q0_9RHOO|nr:IS21-like element helper ATPase IstB [Propionivibrio dicarboxylicus]SDH05054.1 DNA replication protein DnaC [Propionivibrio dicarboxylicus]
MLTHHSLTQLKTLRLDGMARAFEDQLGQPGATALSFEDRFAMIVDREIAFRDSKRLTRLLKQAKLKVGGACLEDVDYRPGRGLDKGLLASLGGGDWIRHHHNCMITGSTGSGKTWLACALGNAACRQGFSALYIRLPRLFEELRIAHGDGSFTRRLAALAKTDLLLIDDWGLAPPSATERSDLLEILDDRVGTRSTVITSQLPVEHWHEYLGEPTLADAILDRILHAAHRLPLAGESMRKAKPA